MRERKNKWMVCLSALCLLGFLLAAIIQPDETISRTERRKLAQFPAVSWETIKNGTFMSAFDSYTQDQFVLREQFRRLKSGVCYYLFGQKDVHGLYVKEDVIAKIEYPLNTDSVSYAAKRFRAVYEDNLADTNANIYLAVVPDKGYFMAEENDYLSFDYDAMIQQLKTQMDFAEYIDIFDCLQLDDYYRTDTHWRQEKLEPAAQKIAETMGVTLGTEYEKIDTNIPFYGVYYGQLAMDIKPDSVSYLNASVLENCVVYDYETNTTTGIYEPDKLYGYDAYELFLGGSKSLLTIENPNASTNRELILFRDSFASSIAPLFAEAYQKITLIDIRYLPVERLGSLIEFGDQDVLFLYSTSVLNHSETLK